MSWRIITEADLETVLSSAELESIRAAVLRAADPQATPPTTAQPDPVQPTLDLVTSLVRGYISASGRYVMGATGMPQSLIAPACDIAAYRIYARVNLDPGSTRQKQHDDAIALLKSVASGDYGLEEPLVVSTEIPSAPSPSIHRKHHHFSPHNQNGL